jgi:hypothetical protein
MLSKNRNNPDAASRSFKGSSISCFPFTSYRFCNPASLTNSSYVALVFFR